MESLACWIPTDKKVPPFESMYFPAHLLFTPGLLQSFKARRNGDCSPADLWQITGKSGLSGDTEIPFGWFILEEVPWWVSFFDEDPFWILLSPKWRFPNSISPKRFLSKPFNDLQDELQPLFYRAPEVGNCEKHQGPAGNQWMELGWIAKLESLTWGERTRRCIAYCMMFFDLAFV